MPNNHKSHNRTGWQGVINFLGAVVLSVVIYFLLIGLAERLDRNDNARGVMEQEIIQLRAEVDCLYNILGYESHGVYLLAKRDCHER